MQTQEIGHQQFFLQPTTFVQRRYEVLRAVVVDEQPLQEVATRYQVNYGTVLAHGCYRWLATRLRGFDSAKPKQVFRKFVETSGTVEIDSGRRIVVYFDRRAHNPILREAALDKDCPKILWADNHRLQFVYL